MIISCTTPRRNHTSRLSSSVLSIPRTREKSQHFLQKFNIATFLRVTTTQQEPLSIPAPRWCLRAKTQPLKPPQIPNESNLQRFWNIEIRRGGLFVGEKSGRFLTTFLTLEISIYFYAKLTISLRKTYSIMPYICTSQSNILYRFILSCLWKISSISRRFYCSR